MPVVLIRIKKAAKKLKNIGNKNLQGRNILYVQNAVDTNVTTINSGNSNIKKFMYPIFLYESD
jgi:hypothetical protein